MRTTILEAIAVSAGLLAATSSVNATAYTFTEIAVPGASGAAFTGINDAEQISGWFRAGTDVAHGFVDTGGSFTQLDVPGAFGTFASKLNDAGQIVGWFNDSTGTHGFLYTTKGPDLGKNGRPDNI